MAPASQVYYSLQRLALSPLLHRLVAPGSLCARGVAYPLGTRGGSHENSRLYQHKGQFHGLKLQDWPPPVLTSIVPRGWVEPRPVGRLDYLLVCPLLKAWDRSTTGPIPCV